MIKNQKSQLIGWCAINLTRKKAINKEYSIYRLKHLIGTFHGIYINLEEMAAILNALDFTVQLHKNSLYSNASVNRKILTK
jgi:hypothetical protein